MKLLDIIRGGVRHMMRGIARFLNSLTGGKLSPNMVTITGLLAHIPIALLIAQGYLGYAALGLVVFGLFDTLDGELARLQKRPSAVGMFLDSATDRMKEIMLYCGIAVFMLNSPVTNAAIVILVAALGVSMLTSYLNAWGEVVLANYTSTKDHKLNKTFRNGLLGFELRMFLIIVGLLTDKLAVVLSFILVLGILTVWQRFMNIIRHLKDV